MAKTVPCAFCGKELTTGLFKGTENLLRFELHSFSCCDDCFRLYDNKDINARFEVKLRNMKYKTRKKPTNDDVLKMYRAYIDECTAHAMEIPMQATKQESFYCYTGKYFSVRECPLEYFSTSAAETIKHTAKNVAATGSGLFSKDDITCIEYRKDSFGAAAGLFKRGYNYFIRLNDHTTVSYRPAITRTVVAGWAPFFHRSAEKALRKELEAFRDRIGSDLPIVKVKSFK